MTPDIKRLISETDRFFVVGNERDPCRGAPGRRSEGLAGLELEPVPRAVTVIEGAPPAGDLVDEEQPPPGLCT
jgi:hypothetical protein